MKDLIINTKDNIFKFHHVFNIQYDYSRNTIKFQYFHGIKAIYGLISDIVSFRVY